MLCQRHPGTTVLCCVLVLLGLITTAIDEASAATCTEWAEGRSYGVGEVVTHQGLTYTNIQAHTAWVGANWTPPRTPALWSSVGTCDAPVGTFHELGALPGEHTLTINWQSRHIDGSSVGRWQVWEEATKIHDSTNIQTFTVEPPPGCTSDCFAGVVSLGHAVLFNITAGEHTYVFKLCDAAGNVCNASVPHTAMVRAPTVMPLSTVSVPGPCAVDAPYPTWSEGPDYEFSQAAFSRTGQFLVQLDTVGAFTGIFVANNTHRSSTANEPIVSDGRPQWNPFWHLAAVTKSDCTPPVPPLGPVTFSARSDTGSVSFNWNFDSVFGDASRWQIWERTVKVLDSTTIATLPSQPDCQTISSCSGPTYRAGTGRLNNVVPGAHSYVLRLCDKAEAMCSFSEPLTVTVERPKR